jgi:hypothetical protein
MIVIRSSTVRLLRTASPWRGAVSMSSGAMASSSARRPAAVAGRRERVDMFSLRVG